MGQAFDERGNVLGEAFGDTKREVFDKLTAEFKDAAEIRIRSFYRSGDTDPRIGAGASAEMPRYRSHKEVWALKIARIRRDGEGENRETDGSALLDPEDIRYGPIHVDHDYMRKHKPHVGGYYVVYKDGYKSFSPAAAFEEGYTRL